MFLSTRYHAFVQLAYRFHVPGRIGHFDPECRGSLEVLVDVPLVFEFAAYQQPLIYGLFLLPLPLSPSTNPACTALPLCSNWPRRLCLVLPIDKASKRSAHTLQVRKLSKDVSVGLHGA